MTPDGSNGVGRLHDYALCFSVQADSVDRTPVFLLQTLFLQNPAVPGSVFPQGACLV